ncbi:hypothetical protein AVEN_149423-1 [Araneus ventricosus]|uniref:Uncharacterized protein n=1 Tax=Araneus ventricosus TaxID=182803 RepID=A0A4Y2PB41_ARAVE|nr:hypothetical protein AVEN_149423-1 [Araneus ventricosus]
MLVTPSSFYQLLNSSIHQNSCWCCLFHRGSRYDVVIILILSSAQMKILRASLLVSCCTSTHSPDSSPKWTFICLIQLEETYLWEANPCR